jgi:hypothetical protein
MFGIANIDVFRFSPACCSPARWASACDAFSQLLYMLSREIIPSICQVHFSGGERQRRCNSSSVDSRLCVRRIEVIIRREVDSCDIEIRDTWTCVQRSEGFVQPLAKTVHYVRHCGRGEWTTGVLLGIKYLTVMLRKRDGRKAEYKS